MNKSSINKNQENALLWFIKVLAGGLILVFLVIHFIVNHLVAPGGLLTFQDVVKYYQNPGVLVMEGFFLTFVLVHALLGLRSILLDLHPSDSLMKIANIGLIILGVATLVYGIWLLIAVRSMAAIV
jgi:succinate dehydrogenase hydrophobic anchor subunit